MRIVHVKSDGYLHTESKKKGIKNGHREVICCHKDDNKDEKCDVWSIDKILSVEWYDILVSF